MAWPFQGTALNRAIPVLAAGVEIVIALAWQTQEQRSVDLVVAAGALILALWSMRGYLAWRIRYLEELYERAHRVRTDKR